MKKALSMILVLTMVLALALPAMAEEIIVTWPSDANSKVSTQNVTATYTKESHTETKGDVLYFTITWTPAATQTLKYTGEQATYTWNGANMSYNKNTDTADGYVAAGWYGSTGYTVEVKNQSNIDLKVTNSASENTYNLTLTQSIDDAKAVTYAETSKVLERASKNVSFEGGATGTPTTVKVSYTYAAPTDGATPPEAPTSGETLTVGTLTVKVEKNA